MPDAPITADSPPPAPPLAPAPRVAERLRPFGTTIFAEMTALANRHGAVNLSQGFPDDPGPELAHDAAFRAMRAGHNQYAPMPGVLDLRRAIAAWCKRGIGLEADPDREITVTSGATEALAAAMLGLINPGDEVVLFEPYYDSYRACVAMAGGVPRFVTLRPHGERFTFDPAQLRTAFSAKTRAVVVNSPHNPTGTVFSKPELQQIADLCREHNAVAISDEVYERLTYRPEQPHVSIASLEGMRERTVVISSIGKTFSLTGWKVGWAVASPELTAGIRAAHQFLTFAVPTPLQHACAVMLDLGDEQSSRIVAHNHAMLEKLRPALVELGFRVYDPAGTYFIMAEHSAVSQRIGVLGDVELCRWLTSEAKVAAIPPSAFYQDAAEGSKYIRFAFCKRAETIDEAIRRLRGALG
jgi:N-succinyldiaminopimelate aminotransferase